MTNLEAIRASIGGNYPVDDASFALALATLGLDPDAEYVPGQTFDLALISLIDTLIGGVSRISEGGYTIELNMDALLGLRSLLLRRWGLVDYSKPYLRDRTNMW